MSRLISRALAAALVLAVPAVQGCDSCGGSKKKAALAKKKAKSKKNRKKGKKKGKARKKNLDAGLAPQSGVAAVVHLGDRALLWTEGRTSALGRKVEGCPGLRWASAGPRRTAARCSLPVERCTGVRRPPRMVVRWPISSPSPMLLGGLRTDRERRAWRKLRLGLTAPGGRSYRLGMSRDTPKTTAWLKGVLPSGVKATSPLAKDTAWPKDAEGRLTNALPEGLTAVTAAPAAAEKTASWTADLKKLAGAEATVAGSMVPTSTAMARMKPWSAWTAPSETTGASSSTRWVASTSSMACRCRGAAGTPRRLLRRRRGSLRPFRRGSGQREGGAPIGHALYFDGGAYQVSLHR